jgi:hypothetical protein
MTLRVTELDFDSILANLKTYLQSQDEFRDYDFDGSALSILLKILAYNTHYGAYYANMVANESFPSTALLAKSIYAHAKTLNYLPGSRVASRAAIDVDITTPLSYVQSTFTLPKYQQFISESVDGANYSFVTLDSYTATRTNTTDSFAFSNVAIYQGEPVNIRYTVNANTNPKLRFAIPSANVDINTLTVQLQESSSNTLTETFEINTNVTEVDNTTKVYFLEKSSDLNYTIYFGDGVIGRKPNNGNILIINYLVTSGDAANKVRSFTMIPIANASSVSTSTLTVASGGGAEESLDSIKLSAPIYYTTQNRALTKSDYEVILKKDFPSISSVSVWGGEENNPPIYGRVFISINPRAGYNISSAEKDRIVNHLIQNRVSLSIKPEIVAVGKIEI